MAVETLIPVDATAISGEPVSVVNLAGLSKFTEPRMVGTLEYTPAGSSSNSWNVNTVTTAAAATKYWLVFAKTDGTFQRWEFRDQTDLNAAYTTTLGKIDVTA